MGAASSAATGDAADMTDLAVLQFVTGPDVQPASWHAVTPFPRCAAS
jgi:hypothetical protein